MSGCAYLYTIYRTQIPEHHATMQLCPLCMDLLVEEVRILAWYHPDKLGSILAGRVMARVIEKERQEAALSEQRRCNEMRRKRKQRGTSDAWKPSWLKGRAKKRSSLKGSVSKRF